jgi:hypothetical protein
MKKKSFRADLAAYLQDIESGFNKIPGNRIGKLQQLGAYTVSSLKEDHQARLLFVCTHNSRRSQFAQLWALTAARFYGIQNIRTYSGGTGATAFHPYAVAAIRRAGFHVEKQAGDSDNPKYIISSGENIQDDHMFSKRYDHEANPDAGFCAVMVCTDADQACPFVSGAEERISLPYDDPKAYDGTDLEITAYDERCRQIAREMFYVFRHVKTIM